MFDSTAGSISAQFTVFAAFVISRHLCAASGVTVRHNGEALRTLRDVTTSITGHQLTTATRPAGAAADILVTPERYAPK